jgi:hypothetical protein
MLTTQVINKEFFKTAMKKVLSKIIREKFNVDYYRNNEGGGHCKTISNPGWHGMI